ncbi:hypothetical protein PA598K_02463 [Paenibacillus sp. 598K]|uniref:ABC transporter substrate-binding protein n=1 Tax=Paenibacillus sp. 598K TaxID=1117987 RepID=UPI000FFA3AEC|nr:ABC transporter substrate-binding protein [Paenibacillus sp. 598K]GBF74132.1 hypothetical protein PA598K_02463 [Paenibacillus sp. 598K]
MQGISKMVVQWMTVSLLIIALTACGASPAPSESSKARGEAQASNATEEAAGTADPTEKSIDTSDEADGGAQTTLYRDASDREVEIPLHPQRIIAHFYAPEMVTLGANMVGTNYVNAQKVLQEQELAGVEDVGGDTFVPNLEKVLELDPDLIIVPDFLEEAGLEALSKIAPTVTVDYSSDVFSRMTALGEIVGMQQQAADWIADYKAKAEAKRRELTDVIGSDETVSAFVVYMDKQLYVYGPQRFGPTMYDALGMRAPEALEQLFRDQPGELWYQISQEQLADYAGDHLFLVTPDNQDTSTEDTSELIDSKLWSNLPAVKNGNAYIVSSRWSFNDSVTLEWLLEEMPKKLLGE